MHKAQTSEIHSNVECHAFGLKITVRIEKAQSVEKITRIDHDIWAGT